MNTKIEVFSIENSSNLSQIEFDHLTNVLSVQFKNGTKYQYVNVDYKIFEEFTKAQSAGKFFMKEIKNKFEYIRRT